jgi:hypothetical protein
MCGEINQNIFVCEMRVSCDIRFVAIAPFDVKVGPEEVRPFENFRHDFKDESL